MAIPVWPAALPFQPEQETWKLILNSGVITSDMDQGEPMRRNRFVFTPFQVSMTWHFQGADFALFMSFWGGTLLKGSKSFKVNIWDGSSYGILTAKFIEDPDPSGTGVTDTRVSAKVSVRGMTWLDEGASWFVGEYGEDFTVLFTDQTQRIVNVDTPAALVGQ